MFWNLISLTMDCAQLHNTFECRSLHADASDSLRFTAGFGPSVLNLAQSHSLIRTSLSSQTDFNMLSPKMKP